MSLKIVFPAEKASVTSSSLYQWDYGQTLEIESADLLPIVEVHFACIGMTEAIVRPCSVNNGLATVTIPDICLEHAGTIMAWVFEIDGTVGMTRKTISIPVIGRVKPAPGGEIPAEFYDRYTELIREINEAITALTQGNVTVTQAKVATYATEAGTAISAEEADRAHEAEISRKIEILDTIKPNVTAITQPGLYMVEYCVPAQRDEDNEYYTDMIFVSSLDIKTAGSSLGYRPTSGEYEHVGVIWNGERREFNLINVAENAFITNIWLLATEYQGS